jgi:hypothetical protein
MNSRSRTMKNWNLARRDLLKQLGVGAACLPLLRSGFARAQAGTTPGGAPRRFIVLQMSEGLRMAGWQPQNGSLMSQTLPSSSASFDAHKADMMFVHGMNNPGGGGGHGSYGCVYFGLGGTGGGQYKEPTGKTVDQVVADGLPKPASGHTSLHLHIQLERAPRSTTSPGGSRCFWKGQGQPINPQGDPLAVYREIFAGGDVNPNADPEAVKRLMQGKKSVLDYVGGTLTDFSKRLGTEDREAIGAHQNSIRELEKQLTSAPASDGKCGGSPDAMIDINNSQHYPLILKAHLGLMVAALKCGVTNVATLQTGDSSGNNINFAFVPGIPEKSKNNYKSPFRNWHDLGHNPVMDGVDHKRIVDKWFFDRWAELFVMMKAVPENGGSLFDNTITLIGNHVQDGGSHNSNAIPWMLAGGKAMNYLNLGNCISGQGNKVSSVMAGIAGAMGVMNNPYGAPLAGLKKG